MAVYTYESPVVEVLAVEPSSGPPAGGTAVVITGRGFVPGVAVLVGGAAAIITDDSSPDRIAILTPAHVAGPVDVVVTNPDATTTTLEDGFTYETDPPPDYFRYWETGGSSGSVARMRTENAAPHIRHELGGTGSFTFSTTTEPAGESLVEYRARGQLLFLGTVVRKKARVDGAERLNVWDCEAADLSHRLSRRRAAGEWVATSASVILSDLMAQFGAGFTAVIEPGLPPTTAKLDGSADLWAAINDVCGRVGAKCFLDGSTVHVFTVNAGYATLLVYEGNPDLQWTDQGQPLTVEYDYAGIVNRVRVVGAEGLETVVEDAASIATYGTTEFTIHDDTLTTIGELVAAGQAKLKESAQPVPIVRYFTRDLQTAIGRSVAIGIDRPAIAGMFVIQSVEIDQLDVVAQGVNPRFAVTAKPASAGMRSGADAGIAVLLETVVDLAAAAHKQPRLSGEITSDPGGKTTIPDGSITAGKLAGCIDSDLMTETGVAPGPYGDGAHLTALTIDAAGRVTAAATDPVPVAKTDGSQPYTADQPMGGHRVVEVGDPIDDDDAATKAYVDAAVAAGVGGAGVTGEVPTGAINGVNAVYTTASAYGDSLAVYLNGVRQQLATDYTETTATTFTFATAPLAGDVVLVDYGGAGGGGGGAGGDIKSDGTVPFAADQSLGGHKLIAVANPGAAQDAATKAYVDAADAGSVKANGSVPFTADQSIGAHKLTNLADPGAAQDAATRAYVDAAIAAIPGGGAAGALVLLATATAAASAAIAIATRNAPGQSGAIFQADYDEYQIEIINLIPTTTGVAIVRVSTDGGATYDAGANYQWANSIQTPGGGTGFTAVASATGATSINPFANTNVATTAVGGGLRLSARIYDPLSATAHKAIVGEGTGRNNGDSNHYRLNFGGYYISATPVNALQFLYASGTIASGKVRIYGIAK